MHNKTDEVIGGNTAHGGHSAKLLRADHLRQHPASRSNEPDPGVLRSRGSSHFFRPQEKGGDKSLASMMAPRMVEAGIRGTWQ